MFIYYIVSGLKGEAAQGWRRSGGLDMSCCPRETSPRSFHSPRSVPRSLTVVVACFAAPPRPFDDLGLFMV